jgi:hypothetical protein
VTVTAESLSISDRQPKGRLLIPPDVSHFRMIQEEYHHLDKYQHLSRCK